MTESATTAVAQQYYDKMSTGDLPGATALFADDIVWHQPGGNRFSGTRTGAAAVGEMIGEMMTVSEGTFRLAFTGQPQINGPLAALGVHFTGRRGDAEMSIDGVDVLRIADSKIAEVWLFSSDQEAEDTFWGAN